MTPITVGAAKEVYTYHLLASQTQEADVRRAVIACLAVIAVALTIFYVRPHQGIRQVPATIFWVGEAAKADNDYIPNNVSAWDDQWQAHFGGVDDPTHRQAGGKWPAGFTPKENPFYVALPYDEFTADGHVKSNVIHVPWYNPAHPPTPTFSILKNHWVCVSYNGRLAFAQLEDVGPMKDDDVNYVFGSARPAYGASGLDMSPAVAAQLGFGGSGNVSWWFVDERDVSPGPWTEIITTRQVSH